MEGDKDVTVTWLELMILFDIHGYNSRHTRQARMQELDRARQTGCSRTRMWDQHLASKGRTMQCKPRINENIAPFSTNCSSSRKQ